MSEENKTLEQSQETQTAESEANKTENKQEPKTITRTQEEDNELFRREAGKAKSSVCSKLGVKGAMRGGSKPAQSTQPAQTSTRSNDIKFDKSKYPKL